MKSHVASLVGLSALVLSVSVMAQDTITKKPQGGPPPLGIHWAKGVKLAPLTERHLSCSGITVQY